MIVHGREIGQRELDLIRGLLRRHSDWHRTRLSRELCQRWNWCNAAGQPKDMACRSLLLRLERAGHIGLPARRGPSVNARRNRVVPEVEHCCDPIVEPLEDLLPLDIVVVGSGSGDAALLRSLMGQYHYLGLGSVSGENLKYLVRDRHGRVLGGLYVAGAAWRCAGRDRYIGWADDVRVRNLPLVANNTRFLLLPWVRVKNLASHLLGRVVQRIGGDWEEKYAHRIYALETFVDRERFTGACYRAANWRQVGQTTGRTRNDLLNRGPLSSIKDVYVYPLSKNFRRALCADPFAENIQAGAG